MVYLLTPPHFGRGKRRGRRPPGAEGARRGATPRATHGSLSPESRAAEPRRCRGRGRGEQGGTGTAGRDLQWGHKDVHWSHTPPYSLRLSPPAPSHSLAPPKDQPHAPTPQQAAGATRPYC
jgi:hypothetical protein